MSFWSDFVNRFNNEYPFTDYQKINLDWLLDGMKACIEAVENFVVDTVLNTTSDHAIANSTVTQALAQKYAKPLDGIPASDLSESVQASLDRADSALQSVPNTYRTAGAQDAIDAGKQDLLLSSGAAQGDLIAVASVDQQGKPLGWNVLKNRFVRYTSQNITDAQKERARANIGAQQVLINSGASVGNYLRVASVDSNGKPLTWETGTSPYKVRRSLDLANPDFQSVVQGVTVNYYNCVCTDLDVFIKGGPGDSISTRQLYLRLSDGSTAVHYYYSACASLLNAEASRAIWHQIRNTGEYLSIIRSRGSGSAVAATDNTPSWRWADFPGKTIVAWGVSPEFPTNRDITVTIEYTPTTEPAQNNRSKIAEIVINGVDDEKDEKKARLE